MIITCYRCGKELDSPDDRNADYIIAEDTIAREPREVFVALKQNEATLAKTEKLEVIADKDYDQVEIPDFEASKSIDGLVKVIVEVRDKDIQKTGVICPECYKPADTVIWGVHKKEAIT